MFFCRFGGFPAAYVKKDMLISVNDKSSSHSVSSAMLQVIKTSKNVFKLLKLIDGTMLNYQEHVF